MLQFIVINDVDLLTPDFNQVFVFYSAQGTLENVSNITQSAGDLILSIPEWPEENVAVGFIQNEPGRPINYGTYKVWLRQMSFFAQAHGGVIILS